MDQSVDQSLPKALQDVSLKHKESTGTIIEPFHDHKDRRNHETSDSVPAVPHPASVPRHRVRSVRVDGIVTDVSLQLFSERVVITCSQTTRGRIGHWLLCKLAPVDATRNPNIVPTDRCEWDVTHLLGAARDDPIWTVYAKHVAERIVQQHSTTLESQPSAVLLGLTLDPTRCRDPAFFHAIVNLLASTYIDTISETL